MQVAKDSQLKVISSTTRSSQRILCFSRKDEGWLAHTQDVGPVEHPVRIISATLMNIFLHTPSFFCLLKKATCDASILRFAYASEARQAVPFSFSIQQSWVDKECPTCSSAWTTVLPFSGAPGHPNPLDQKNTGNRLRVSIGATPTKPFALPTITRRSAWLFTLSWFLNSSERSCL